LTGLRKRIEYSNDNRNHVSTDDSPYGVLIPSRSTGSTLTTVATPLRTDAVVLSLQLPNWLVLTQLNVWQATLINSRILGMSHFFANEDDQNNDFNGHDDGDEEDPAYTPHYLSPPSSQTPSSLQPTPLQQSTPHFPWIDLVPHAGMRDTLIRAGSRLDVHDFCADMLGSMFNNTSSSSRNESGFMVWGESWLVESWEMTEGFVRKYAWLLEDEGCEEMMRATNRWRERRGEEILVVC
jgi:hypothetical protein